MSDFNTKIVLSDIEGTTTSISFVKDVLFPYAKTHTKTFLEETWTDSTTQDIVRDLCLLPKYREFSGVTQSSGGGDGHESVSAANISQFVNFLIDKDLKLGPLKTLQGLVWSKGYANGSIQGHVYPDVPDAFKRWHETGIQIAIYSSGSVKAQKLLFGQTEYGNLLPYINGHYDTAVGSKQDAQSYTNIAKDLGSASQDILFLTDIVKEAESAKLAGMQVVLLNRPGNAPLTDDDKLAFTVVNDFDDLNLSLRQ